MVAKVAPLVVIVGETASGKSDLAMFLAKKFYGEIIAADSRTIYRGMDIGTAKPTKEDQRQIKHHLIDIVNPNERYNTSRFQEDASSAIADIVSRGKLPIMVGGTGLYVDSVIYNYDFDNKTMDALRQNTLILGVSRDREDLKQRIEKRIDRMVAEGLIDEVKSIGQNYGWSAPAMNGIGYRAFADYIQGKITIQEAKDRLVKENKDLAKRQRTWFKRNKSIHWITQQSEAVDFTTTLLKQD